MTTEVRDRVVGLRRVRAGDLVPNPLNWRTHSTHQADALRGILGDVGYVDALIARELPDGQLQLVNGHLRRETTPDVIVPVPVVDLDDEEAAKVLATFDPIGGLAGTDQTKLDELIDSIRTDDAGLALLLGSLASVQPVLGPELDESLADGVTICVCPTCKHEHHRLES